MGSTVLIFGGIALAWVAYFTSQWMRRSTVARPDAAAQLASAVPVFRDAPDAPVVDRGGNPIDLSTPLTRRAEVAAIRAVDRLAARRRRMFAAVGLGLVLTVVALAWTGYVPWWSVAIPGGVLVAVLAFNRVSVRILRRQLDERYAAVKRCGEEETVALAADGAGDTVSGGVRMDVTEGTQDLWGPLPITRPTYVSKPLAPRTVRTIDLSAPASPTSAPVTQDAPATDPVTPRPTLVPGERSA